jgi:hypothetical protein
LRILKFPIANPKFAIQNFKPLAFVTYIPQSKNMFRLVSLAGLLLLNNLPSLLACEGCKEPSNVAGQSGVAGISASFSWSVLFMLTVVASLLTGLVFMMVRSCRQLAAQHESTGAPLPVASRVPVPVRRLSVPGWRGIRARLFPQVS